MFSRKAFTMSAVNPAGAHGLTNSQGNEVATASQRLCCRRCVVRWTRNSEYGQENNWTHPKDPSLTCECSHRHLLDRLD